MCLSRVSAVTQDAEEEPGSAAWPREAAGCWAASEEEVQGLGRGKGGIRAGSRGRRRLSQEARPLKPAGERN